MAIDDLIAQGVRPPEVPTLGQAYAQMQEQRAREQQVAAGALQLQTQRLQLQQAQQDFQDQQTMRQAYMDSAGDMNKFQSLVRQRGVSPKAIMSIQQQMLAMKKSVADLDDVTLKNEQARHDQLRGDLTSYIDQSDAAKAANWQPWIQSHVEAGKLTPPEAQQLLQQYPSYPGDQQAKLYANGLATGSQLAKEESERRTADARKLAADTGAEKQRNEAPGQIADAAQKERVNLAGELAAAPDPQTYAKVLGDAPHRLAVMFPPPEQWNAQTPALVRQIGLTADQQRQAAQAQQTAAETARHNQVEETQGQTRNAIEGGRLKVEQQRFGFESSGGVSDAAKMAAEGKMSPQTLRSMIRSNPGIIAQIRSVDPQFDEANIENRYNTLKEFGNTSTAKAGGQALALNTLIHHADLYMQTAEALKNGSFRPGNAVYNAVANAFGAAPPTNANLVARFFAGETGKVATGGVPAEGEINGILKNLNNDAGPEQIAGAGQTLLQIAAGRAVPLMERAKAAKIDGIMPVLGPDAQRILTQRGFDPATMKPAAASPAASNAAPQYKIGDTVMYQGKPHKITDIRNGKLVLAN